MKYGKTILNVLLILIPVALFSQTQPIKGTPGSSITLKRTWATTSLFASGDWFKISIPRTGIYKVSYSDLQSLGMALPASSDKIRLFGNGGAMLPELNGNYQADSLNEIAISVYDGGDGSFNSPSDYFIFYAEGTELWKYDSVKTVFTHTRHDYSDVSDYFITAGTQAGKRVAACPAVGIAATDTVSTFNYYDVHELDSVNLLKSGRLWLGECFAEDTVLNLNFSVPGIVDTSKVKIRLSLMARSMVNSLFTCTAYDTTVQAMIAGVDPNLNSEYAHSADFIFSCKPDTSLAAISLSYQKPDDASLGWLDFVEINCLKALNFTGGQLAFRRVNTGIVPVSEFRLNGFQSGLRVWNVTNAANAAEISYSPIGNEAVFKAYTDSLQQFVAFDGSLFYSPMLLGKIANQNLHGMPQADLIVVSHPDFLAQANILAEYHRNTDGLTAVVVTPEQIYNEFSSGMQDVSAIRDFVRMFYDRADGDSVSAPKYLLLFGDGSYDMKNRLPGNTNFIPTYQTINSTVPTASFVSDDYFGLLEPGEGPNVTGDVDIGIGRLPTESLSEAKMLVDKILSYDSQVDLSPDDAPPFTLPTPVSNYSDWRNTICFVADDEDNNLHLSQAEGLIGAADSVSDDFNFDKIYLDAFKQENTPSGARYPDVNAAIHNRIDKGALIVNYTGHGSESGWASENVLSIPEIGEWNNRYNLPAFITATCEFSRFDNPLRRSAGEFILLNPHGGGIALFSTTRVAYAHSNEVINRKIIKSALNSTDGNFPRMGDAIKDAKRACGPGVYMQNFMLLGDPALRLAYPDLKVATTMIDGNATDSIPDSLLSGHQITVHGAIMDYSGAAVTNFNGYVYPTVFDIPCNYLTLANDPWSSHQWFKIQNKILYKGRISVVNGAFSFTFVVPEGISFGSGNARISYYAKSAGRDARGVYEKLSFFHDSIANADNAGPDITLFLDNTGFKSGDITGDSPVLLAGLYDTNGIDAYGTGLGRDITAVLDERYESTIVLNDYYRPSADTWTGGTLAFPFFSLSSGRHKIRLRASDLLGNTSEAFTEFIVADASKLELGKIYNFPNPFISYTDFYIEHNQTLAPLDVIITIFDSQGRPVRTLKAAIDNGDNKFFTARWDGSNDYGSNLPQGLYVYSVKLLDNRGVHLEKSGKLIILK
ncbi:MAG: type IX secretion system sortase PorU [Bacteroidota bacterium]